MIARMWDTQQQDTRIKFRELLELRSKVIDDFIADSVLAISIRTHGLAMMTQPRDAEESQRLLGVARLAQRVAEQMEVRDPTYAYSVADVLVFAHVELNLETL